VGKRMKIDYTRAMIRAALSGALDAVGFERDPVFNVDVPTSCPDVPREALKPRSTWASPAEYDRQAARLAQMFHDNFKSFADRVSEDVRAAGPA
jgi:phosphoenolpyruvate carboxykinase (ATP)